MFDTHLRLGMFALWFVQKLGAHVTFDSKFKILLPSNLEAMQTGTINMSRHCLAISTLPPCLLTSPNSPKP